MITWQASMQAEIAKNSTYQPQQKKAIGNEKIKRIRNHITHHNGFIFYVKVMKAVYFDDFLFSSNNTAQQRFSHKNVVE